MIIWNNFWNFSNLAQSRFDPNGFLVSSSKFVDEAHCVAPSLDGLGMTKLAELDFWRTTQELFMKRLIVWHLIFKDLERQY